MIKSSERTFQHNRTKDYALIHVSTQQEHLGKLVRWVEIQLAKHGWYPQ